MNPYVRKTLVFIGFPLIVATVVLYFSVTAVGVAIQIFKSEMRRD